MKKKFYFPVVNPYDEIDAIEEVVVEMEKVHDDPDGDYLPPYAWECRTVKTYIDDFSQRHPGSFAWGPYKRLITEYDPYWIICSSVFRDEEYMKKNSDPDPDDHRYYS